MSHSPDLGASILVIEDDPDVARVLADALTFDGYVVRHARNAADARTFVNQATPDLIILDLMLPDEDGLVVCVDLKAHSQVPVIVCSGSNQKRDRLLSLKLGADDYITKPFDVDELLARVHAVLRRSMPSREFDASRTAQQESRRAADEAGTPGPWEVQQSDGGHVHDLRAVLSVAAASGIIGSPSPHARLLQQIVETATHLVRARTGCVALLQEKTRELVVEYATGFRADELHQLRSSLDSVIEGLVVGSTQPMAVSYLEGEPHQAQSILDRVQYFPQSALCVPLVRGARVLGVLEVVEKTGERSFTAEDTEALTLFASQVVIALDEEHPVYDAALDIASLVQEIVERGQLEADACKSMLQGLAEYLRKQPHSVGEAESAQ